MARHPELAAAHTLEALRHCVTAARLSEGAAFIIASLTMLRNLHFLTAASSFLTLYSPLSTLSPQKPPADATGARTAKQARHAVSALLSHALPPCRARVLVEQDVTPAEARQALAAGTRERWFLGVLT
jgi:hypothetical protein